MKEENYCELCKWFKWDSLEHEAICMLKNKYTENVMACPDFEER